MTTLQETFLLFAEKIKNEINCQLPARVTQVNEDGTVNVVAIRNDEIEDCVITVPVLRPETQRVYIQLKIKAGDRGVIKFCDKSIEEYRKGNENYNNDDRTHSISDGVFQLGFLPSNERFVYPEGELVIGLKNNTFTLSVDENGNLTIKASLVKIDSETIINGNTTINGDTTINGNTMINGSLGVISNEGSSISGNLEISGGLTATNDIIAGNISLEQHTHTGNLGNPTSPPN